MPKEWEIAKGNFRERMRYGGSGKIRTQMLTLAIFHKIKMKPQKRSMNLKDTVIRNHCQESDKKKPQVISGYLGKESFLRDSYKKEFQLKPKNEQNRNSPFGLYFFL
jgi:hypothetical protein